MTAAVRRDLSRKISAVMYGLCIAFAAIILVVLVLITGYLLFIGIGHLSLSFFTKEPIAQGNPGFPGGMANGLEGTEIDFARFKDLVKTNQERVNRLFTRMLELLG